MWIGVTLGETSPTELASRLGHAKTHLRVLNNDEDALIAGYLGAAVSHVEGVTGTQFYRVDAVLEATTWEDLDNLPVSPIGDEVKVTYMPRGAVEPAELDPPARVVRIDPLAKHLIPGFNTDWPAAEPGYPITVTTTAGYDCPPTPVWQAILLLVGQWYRNRMAINVGNIVNDLPNGVDSLLANHKRQLL